MAFIDRSYVLSHIDQDDDENPVVAVYQNDHTNQGQSENRQFLRRYADQSWKLSVNVGFTTFEIPMQAHQAEILLKYELGTKFELAIVKQEKLW